MEIGFIQVHRGNGAKHITGFQPLNDMAQHNLAANAVNRVDEGLPKFRAPFRDQIFVSVTGGKTFQHGALHYQHSRFGRWAKQWCKQSFDDGRYRRER